MPRCNASMRVKFYFLDGFIAAPLLLLMLYPRTETLMVLAVLSTILVLLDKRGMRLPMLMRFSRNILAGPTRYIRPWWRN